jgi:integrase
VLGFEVNVGLAMLLMLSTAGRVSAILELTWDRVDIERNQINLRTGDTETRKGRAVVPINAGLRVALQEAREGVLSDHVVNGRRGRSRISGRGL